MLSRFATWALEAVVAKNNIWRGPSGGGVERKQLELLGPSER